MKYFLKLFRVPKMYKNRTNLSVNSEIDVRSSIITLGIVSFELSSHFIGLLIGWFFFFFQILCIAPIRQRYQTL